MDDALTAEADRRRRALDEWNHSRASMKAPDPAWVQQTYEMLLKKTDPAGAEKFVVSMKATIAEFQGRQESARGRRRRWSRRWRRSPATAPRSARRNWRRRPCTPTRPSAR